MSVKNTKDGSFTIDTSTSEIVQANITYQGLVNATYPTIYTIIDEMCILLLPTIKETPISSSPSTIQIIVPPEITQVHLKILMVLLLMMLMAQKIAYYK